MARKAIRNQVEAEETEGEEDNGLHSKESSR